MANQKAGLAMADQSEVRDVEITGAHRAHWTDIGDTQIVRGDHFITRE